jgi:hypothetical protein
MFCAGLLTHSGLQRLKCSVDRSLSNSLAQELAAPVLFACQNFLFGGGEFIVGERARVVQLRKLLQL